MDDGCTQSLAALIQDKATNLAVILAAGHFGPDHKYICNRRVGNPGFSTSQDITSGYFFGPSLHAARIRAVVGFSQTKAAYPFSRSEFGQVFLLLLLSAKLIDGQHDQRGLHAHHRAVT